MGSRPSSTGQGVFKHLGFALIASGCWLSTRPSGAASGAPATPLPAPVREQEAAAV